MFLLKLRRLDWLATTLTVKTAIRGHVRLGSTGHGVRFTLAKRLLRLGGLEQIELLLARCHGMSVAGVSCVDSTALSANATVCLQRHLFGLSWTWNLIILKSQGRNIIRARKLTEVKDGLVWQTGRSGTLLARAACPVATKSFS